MSLFENNEAPAYIHELPVDEHPDCCGVDLLYGFECGASKLKDYREWLRQRKYTRTQMQKLQKPYAPNIFVVLNHLQFNTFGDVLTKEFKYKVVHSSFNKNSGNDLYYLIYSPTRAKRVKNNPRCGSRPTGTR